MNVKLLQSHEDYIKSVLEDLFYSNLDLNNILYYPFDNYEDWFKYGNVFVKIYPLYTHG